jgi:hypothetical protein
MVQSNIERMLVDGDLFNPTTYNFRLGHRTGVRESGEWLQDHTQLNDFVFYITDRPEGSHADDNPAYLYHAKREGLNFPVDFFDTLHTTTLYNLYVAPEGVVRCHRVHVYAQARFVERIAPIVARLPHAESLNDGMGGRLFTLNLN